VDPATNEAPATPAELCRNSRRDRTVLAITSPRKTNLTPDHVFRSADEVDRIGLMTEQRV
jgi:hypothetical protein